MEVRFKELLDLLIRGVESGISFAFKFQVLLMEWHIDSGMPIVITYDNGETKEIRDKRELSKVLKEVYSQALQDERVKEKLKEFEQA